MSTSFGKYQVLEQVGEGGFGRVFRALDPLLKREVAIKTCTLRDPEVRARFVREAEIVANLKHPHIVTVYDFGVEDGEPFLVQEFLNGRDLKEELESEASIDLVTKVRWLRQIADGLRHAHAHGVIHRDIKPSNIRIQADGNVRIMDFGIAKLLEARHQLTQTGLSIGTTGYLAPEQLKGGDIDHRADIFSFGVLGYELLSGQKPFGDDMTTALYRILHEDPPSLRELVPDCPAPLAVCINRCMEKDREKRFASFGPVIGELDAITPAMAREVSSPVIGPDESRATGRFRITPAGAGLAIAAVAIALFGVLNLSRMGRSETTDATAQVLPPPAGGETLPDDSDTVAPVVPQAAGDPDPGAVDTANAREADEPARVAEESANDSRESARPATPPAAPPPVMTALDARRLVVIVRGDAQTIRDAAESTVISELRDAGYSLVDERVVDATPETAVPEMNAITSLGRSHGAGFVVFIDATSQAVPFGGMFTGSATLTARIYDVRTGSLESVETGAVGSRGTPGRLGPTADGAAADATRSAATQVAGAIRRRLDER